ncbi:GNAT family N-acetyltransferase [Pseudonocardia sp. TRM90224]|uniref:GNAT family N-acetyltransferase n=1 Tax=Pseudonocardia sp. TRM90224 TaxID=2812678 RepID=UPI001E2A4C56|nr:GNAT family N-acetyltransferase [Pseudonocardia sp. TRM90224]
MNDPLENPALAALAGPQAHFAERHGSALRYRAEVTSLSAFPTDPDAAAWADLAALHGRGRTVVINGPVRLPPAGWEVTGYTDCLQFDGTAVEPGEPAADVLVLGPDDVPAMLDLVERTRPGPFRSGTPAMGTYVGVRRGGALVAMAGERLRPAGWSEISAVCTDPAHRGQNLATRLVGALIGVIRDRGERPFLHTSMRNTAAIRLYERMGFTPTRQVRFAGMRTPA